MHVSQSGMELMYKGEGKGGQKEIWMEVCVLVCFRFAWSGPVTPFLSMLLRCVCVSCVFPAFCSGEVSAVPEGYNPIGQIVSVF